MIRTQPLTAAETIALYRAFNGSDYTPLGDDGRMFRLYRDGLPAASLWRHSDAWWLQPVSKRDHKGRLMACKAVQVVDPQAALQWLLRAS